MITFEMNMFANSTPTPPRIMELIRYLYIEDSAGWKIAMHQHEDTCEWEYVIRGHGTYMIDGRQYETHAGDLIFINAGVSHSEWSDANDPLVSWKCTCRAGASQELGGNIILPKGIEPVVHTSPEARKRLEWLCDSFYREFTEKETGYETVVILLTETFFIESIRQIDLNGIPMKERSLNLAMQVKQYIDAHYMEKINLEILSKNLHASKFYIGHEMQKEYQCSPIDYLIRLRMGEAQHLLNTTDASVGEIARKVGYDNVSYFNVQFQKRTGMSPTEFRHQYTVHGDKIN